MNTTTTPGAKRAAEQLETGAPRAGATARRGRGRLLIDLAIVGAAVSVIALLVKLAWPGFTYWGDNANSFLPLWHMVGSAIRDGQSFLFDHTGWAGANVVGEAAYGVFNPVTLANAVAISFLDNLALASFLLMTEFLVLLGCGIYMLARVYGADRAPSLIVAIAFPFAGYTLFYEAGNWASGLMSITWVVHFWWSARAYTTGRMGPVLAVVFGGLAATVGNPYAVLGILVVLFALAVELGWRRRFRRLGGFVLVGVCVGLIVLFVYLPFVNVMGQIDRPVSEFAGNRNYLSPTLSDLFGMSTPSYLPRFRAWAGFRDLVPSTYLFWLILPLLPWLRWGALSQWAQRASLVVASVVFLLFTLGPDKLWLFRWPIRLIEYSYIGIAVLFALLLSAGLARTHLRRRVALTGIIVISSFFIAWASTPSLWGFHALMTAILAALLLLVLVAHRRWAIRGILVVAIAGTAVIAPLQAGKFAWSVQMVGADVDQSVPARLQVVRDASTKLDGTVLQIADIFRVAGDGSVYSGRINFGNTAAAAGVESVNRYTGINLRAFQVALNMDYRGSVTEALRWRDLFANSSGTSGRPLIDLLGVDTLVVSTSRSDLDRLEQWTDGWHVVEQDEVRLVLQRDEPLSSPVVTPSGQVQIANASESGNAFQFEFEAPEGGTVLIDRLGWNGYTAEWNGQQLPVDSGVAGLLRIELPAGAGTVKVDYQVPGLRLGLALLAAAAVLALAHELWWRLVWVRRRRDWTPEIVDPDTQRGNYVI